MKALTLTRTDGPDAVELAEHPTPEPAAGQVRVALKAAALNHRELWITQGLYPGMKLPATLGCDGAGVVEAVGSGVDADQVGREVVIYPGLNWGDDLQFPAPAFSFLGMPGPGTVAETICVEASALVDKPKGLSFEDAAAISLAGLTAWRGLFTKAGLKAGDTLLITGVGGGVAAAALALATAAGAIAFVTSGSEETLERAKAQGAQGGFNYKDPDWRKTVGKATGGIDVVFDGAPASGFANYVRALKMGARVVVYGSTGGPKFPVTATDLFLKNISVIGTNGGNPSEFAQMIAYTDKHGLKPVIDRTFSLAEAKAGLLHLRDGHAFGKVVVSV